MESRNLFSLIIYINVFLGILVLIFKKSQRTYPGLFQWAISHLLFALAYFLLIISDNNLVSILGNTILIAAMFLRIYSLRVFFYLYPFKRIFLILPFIFIMMLFLTYDHSEKNDIISCVFLIFSNIYIGILSLQTSSKEYRLPSLILSFSFFYSMVLHVFRVAEKSIAVNDLNGFTQFINSLFYTSSIMMDIIILIMLLIINNIRLGIEIKRKNEYLKNALELKDKLFSIITKDVKNSLGSLTNMLTDLSKKSGKKNVKNDFLETIPEITKQGESIGNDLENLLSWAAMHNKLLNYNPEKLNLNKMISKCIKKNKSYADQKNISIKESALSSVDVYVDRKMIQKALCNIIANAIKYSYKNKTISITILKIAGFGVIEILDYGIGMSEKNIRNLFDIGNSMTVLGTDGEIGSGMGLILAKDLIQRNAGRIYIKSLENKGTKCIIHLPLSR